MRNPLPAGERFPACRWIPAGPPRATQPSKQYKAADPGVYTQPLPLPDPSPSPGASSSDKGASNDNPSSNDKSGNSNPSTATGSHATSRTARHAVTGATTASYSDNPDGVNVGVDGSIGTSKSGSSHSLLPEVGMAGAGAVFGAALLVLIRRRRHSDDVPVTA